MSAVGRWTLDVGRTGRSLLTTLNAQLSTAWRSQSGFTLIEMVTVFFVISVLTALLLANTQAGDRRQQLRDASAEFVNVIRNAEGRASAASPVNGTSREAYGVCLTSTTAHDGAGTFPKSKCAPPVNGADAYQLYARTAADTDADPSLADPPDRPDILSSHTMPSDTIFFPSSQLYLDFVPPRSTLYLNGSTADRTLYVYSVEANYYRIVRIRPKSGTVYVE